jgi:integral membrane protein (TIGR01906 family)
MRTKGLWIFAAVLAVVLLAFSIAAPIVCRPFYYAHIGPLGLEEFTGLSRQEIKTAYDEMLDYCLGGEEFSTGVLRWSQRGKDHFTDVRMLFLLDLKVLGVFVLLLLALLIAMKLTSWRPCRLLGRGPLFWAGTGLAAVFLIVGGLAALDFDRAFVIFHSLFFPGKSNWLFNYRVDEIILVLPQVVFRNYGILIVGLLLVFCIGLMLADRKKA